MTDWTPLQIPHQSGKTAIVTGANSGTGFHTALELARKGARVVLACRNRDKADTAAFRIKQEAPGASVDVASLDLADLTSVAGFAASFLATGHPLHILINNAGVMAPQKRLLTKDGFELQFGTNHLGHFALTGHLLPLLEKTEGARVVTVSSIAHRRAKLNFDDINSEKSYDPMRAYKQSKLANAVFGMELQKRLAASNSGLKSIIAHPGVANTELASNSYNLGPHLFMAVAKIAAKLVGQTAAQGALPILYAATSKDILGGKLYGPDAFNGWRGYPVVEDFHRSATSDPLLCERLWKISENMTGVRFLS